MAKKNLHGLESCVYQIETRKYLDFTTDRSYFKAESIFTIGNEIIMTCSQLFRRQYIQLRENFIPLCLKSPVRYSFNILRIIKLFYHFYIDYEKYILTYKKKWILNYSLFIEYKMGKCHDDDTFLKIIRI